MTRSPLYVEAIGVRWHVDTEVLDDDQHERMLQLWERAAFVPAAGEDLHTFRILEPGASDGTTAAPSVALTGDFELFPYAFSRALTMSSIAQQRGNLLMLHAAGLSSADGTGALVMYAASGTGKSTAAKRLGRRLGYLTDETVAIDDDDVIKTHPKPISVIVTTKSDKVEHSPDELGLGPTVAGVRVRAVVELHRDEAFTEPVLVPVDLIDGLLHAMAQTSSIALVTHPLDRLARLLSHSGGPWQLQYAEIDTCLELLTDLVEGKPPGTDVPAATWTHLPPVDGQFLVPELRTDLSEPAGARPREPLDGDEVTLTDRVAVQRSPWTDALASDGGVLVLRDNKPTHLMGLGAVIWRLAGEPVTIQEALATAVAEFGDHDEAPVLVERAVRSLLANGMLVEVAPPVS